MTRMEMETKNADTLLCITSRQSRFLIQRLGIPADTASCCMRRVARKWTLVNGRRSMDGDKPVFSIGDLLGIASGENVRLIVGFNGEKWYGMLNGRYTRGFFDNPQDALFSVIAEELCRRKGIKLSL